jgi:FMN phosphatase YigB (HAD superfamily)
MTDPLFRTPAEQTAHDAILTELRARVPSFWRAGVDRDPMDWPDMLASPDGRLFGVKESEAVIAFNDPTDAETSVIADALVHAGTVTDDLYARLLSVGQRRHVEYITPPGPPVTRAVAFDAFGTLVHIKRKRRPFEKLILANRDAARALPSPMVTPIGLADYAMMLGLPPPDAELAMLDEELGSIELYPDALDCLHRVRDQGVKVAVASNLAMPYAAPLKALLGDLVDVWHLSFAEGAIKPDAAFYRPLIAKLCRKPEQLLMVGDTWRDDIVGAVGAGARACWLDRTGQGSYARRFVTVSTLADVGKSLHKRRSRARFSSPLSTDR